MFGKDNEELLSRIDSKLGRLLFLLERDYKSRNLDWYEFCDYTPVYQCSYDEDGNIEKKERTHFITECGTIAHYENDPICQHCGRKPRYKESK